MINVNKWFYVNFGSFGNNYIVKNSEGKEIAEIIRYGSDLIVHKGRHFVNPHLELTYDFREFCRKMVLNQTFSAKFDGMWAKARH